LAIPADAKFLDADIFKSTEFLPRRIIINAQIGNDVRALATQLMSYQNNNGDFGELPGYGASIIDRGFDPSGSGLPGCITGMGGGELVWATGDSAEYDRCKLLFSDHAQNAACPSFCRSSLNRHRINCTVLPDLF